MIESALVLERSKMDDSNSAEEIGNDGERLSRQAGPYSMVHHVHRYAVAAALCEGKRVADLASGEGYGANLIAQQAQHVIGIDIAESAVKHASTMYKRKNLEFKVGSASSIPLPDGSVDVVTSFETIEHHAEHDKMLQEFKRILTPSGLLVLSSPDKLYYTDVPKLQNPFHVKELYEDQLRELIRTYFKNLVVYGQKIVGGSMVFSKDQHSSEFTIFSGGFDGVDETHQLLGSQYLICVASDGPLPTLRASFFDGELLSEIRRQEQSLRNDIRNSISFRIGRAVTAPFRWLRRS